MKTQIDLPTNNLFSGSIEKVKEISSYSRAVEFNFENKINYLNNEGGLKPKTQEIKVGINKGIIIMINLFIKIVNKVIGRIRQIKVGCMHHWAFVIMLQMTQRSFP